MKIVAGLGNPGRAYAGTPHNIGFEVVETLAQRAGGAWRRSLRFRARVCRIVSATPGDPDWLLVEPQTFMNRSGSSLGAVMRYYGCGLTDVVVLLDDVDLPPGRIRIRPDGGSGGHRGLGSVIEALGSGDFTRIRVGIGRGPDPDVVRHVLRVMAPDLRQRLAQAVSLAADAVACRFTQGVAAAMNQYNGGSGGMPDPAGDGQ